MIQNPAFLIREATVDDVPAIRRSIRSSIEGLAAQDYPSEVINSWGLDTEKSREKQRQAIVSGQELTWVAVIENQVVGFSALSPQTAELRAVYISSEVARQGIGTWLLNRVESKAKELGLKKLTMHSSLTALPFYLRHGYINEGEIFHTLSSGAKMKAILMSKELL